MHLKHDTIGVATQLLQQFGCVLGSWDVSESGVITGILDAEDSFEDARL